MSEKTLFKHVLVLDDASLKHDLINRAANEAMHNDSRLHLEVKHATHPKEVTDMTPEELAQFDAILVDFNLNTKRYGKKPPVANITMPSPDESAESYRVEVLLQTGLGVLLYLADRFADPAFAVALEGRLPPLRYAFVDLSEHPSRYFAAAAQSWFAVPTFPIERGSESGSKMARRLAGLGEPPISQDRFARDRVAQRVEALDDLLEHFQTESRAPTWVTEPKGLDAYRWLAVLFENRCAPGKAPYVQAGLIKKGLIGRPNTTTQLHDLLVARLYDKVKTFVLTFDKTIANKALKEACWTESLRELEIESVRAGDDPKLAVARYAREEVRKFLYRELLDSHEFWEADDVATALEWHRARTAKTETVAEKRRRQSKRKIWAETRAARTFSRDGRGE